MKRDHVRLGAVGDPMKSRAASEIGLAAEQAQRIALFSVDRASGRPNLKVRASDLVSALQEVAADVQVVVFVDQNAADGLALQMATSFAAGEVHGLTWHVPATSAVKRIEAGLIVEGVDRETLRALRAPEVVDRHFLERAVSAVDDGHLVNPIELVASSGGAVSIFEASSLHS